MANNHYGSPPQGKHPPQSGIRPADLLEVTQRLEVVEKLIKNNLDERNQWNSKVREWLEKSIVIQLMDSSKVVGVLKWVDRYTLCLQEDGQSDSTIVHKGAIAVIRVRSE